MAQSTEESSLDTLLRTRYPLTYYLSRQQQFTKLYSTTPTSSALAVPETMMHVGTKRKTPLPPPTCFNVPDTLDFSGTAYEDNDEMESNLDTQEVITQEYDSTILLKSNNSRMNETNCDYTININSSIIQRTSGIHLEFSPYENDSPLNQAIQNGLNVINR